MRKINNSIGMRSMISVFFVMMLTAGNLTAQEWSFGAYAAPVISWFKSNIDEVENRGARAGFLFSIRAEKHLTENWYFEGGLSLTNTSARLKYNYPSFFRFPGNTSVLDEGSTVVYRIQYLSVPFGIKIKTDGSDEFTYFAGFGIDPKIVVRGVADIPSISVKGEGAMDELDRLNAGYHFDAGLEYAIGPSGALVLGVGYENNIFDSTVDNDGEIADRAVQRFIKFIFGIKF